MRRRQGQATVEVVGLTVIFAAVLIALGLHMARGDVAQVVVRAIGVLIRREQPHHGDRWAMANATLGPLVRRYAPTLVLERDVYGADDEVPVDFASCRRPPCSRFGTGRPAAFVHVVRRPDAIYVAYWLYYPDSIGIHLPVATLSGSHRDDWEGVIVRIDGSGAAARATAHLGLQGARPWWNDAPGWRRIGAHPLVYRASGSHANGFTPQDIDLAGDAWNGTLASVTLDDLVPADEAPSRHARFDAGASPPWRKLLWRDPEAITTSDTPNRGPGFLAAQALARLLGKG